MHRDGPGDEVRIHEQFALLVDVDLAGEVRVFGLEREVAAEVAA